MQCPKCGTQQAQSEQCSACGIYIEKYEQFLRQQAESVGSSRRGTAASSSSRPILGAVLIIAGVAAGGYALMGNDDAETPAQTVQVTAAPVENSVSQRLNLSHAPRNAIERARNATVFIQTEWGSLGSGYIASSDCRVITNRHVVEFDIEASKQRVIASDEVQTAYNAMLGELLNDLSRKKMQIAQELNMNGETAFAQGLREDIKVLERQIEGLPKDIDRSIEREVTSVAREYSFADLHVSLVDGSEYTVSDIQFSRDHDLATFELDAVDCPFLVVGDVGGLAQGSQLFTIGNPSGLTYTVTSGVFSGFREEDGASYLQTDAPINPGNSGGPLVDPKGRIIGINTLVARDVQNIGFAIPVTVVAEAF